MTHQIVAMNRMAIAEEIEHYAEQNGLSVLYTIIDNTAMGLLSNIGIQMILYWYYKGVCANKNFQTYRDNVTRGKMFVAYQLNDMQQYLIFNDKGYTMEKNDTLIKKLADDIINQSVPATILVEYDGVKTYSAYHIESNYNYKIFLNSSTKSVISAIAPLILQMLKIRGSDIFKLKHDNTLEGLQYALSYEGIDLEYSEGIDLEYIEMAGNDVTIRLSKGIW